MTTPMNQKLIHVLFCRFQAIYGDKWTSRFNTEEMLRVGHAEWLEALSDNNITAEVIKDALSYFRNNVIWPPSIAEFIHYCKNLMPKAYDADHTQRYLANHRAIKEADISVAKSAMANIRAIIAKNAQGSPPRHKVTGGVSSALPDEKKPLSEPMVVLNVSEMIPEKLVNKLHRDYSQDLFDKRRSYLVRLLDNEAIKLSSTDWMDWRSYKNQEEAFLTQNITPEPIANKYKHYQYKSETRNE